MNPKIMVAGCVGEEISDPRSNADEDKALWK